VYTVVPNIVSIELYPYGNAFEHINAYNYYNFACQHGPAECVGDTLEACTKYVYPDIKTHFPLINCIENNATNQHNQISAKVSYKQKIYKDHFGIHFNFMDIGRRCAESLHLDFNEIGICTTTTLGTKLEHEEAERIKLQNHKYVPWIVINGVHNETLQNEAQTNLLNLVCRLYKGKKPKEC